MLRIRRAKRLQLQGSNCPKLVWVVWVAYTKQHLHCQLLASMQYYSKSRSPQVDNVVGTQLLKQRSYAGGQLQKYTYFIHSNAQLHSSSQVNKAMFEVM